MTPPNHKQDGTLSDDSYLFGNWNGFRNSLKKRGITPRFIYSTDLLANPFGGRSQGVAEISDFKFLLDFNLDPLSQGLKFHTSFVFKSGRNLSNVIDNDFTVAELFGGRTYRLVGFYLKKRFAHDCWIKIGRIAAGIDFFTTHLYDFWVNAAFNPNPITVLYNYPPFSTFPKDTWGLVVKWRLNKEIVAKFGIYNANTNIYKLRYHGCNFTFANTNGVELFLQGKYSYEKGNCQIGILYQTGKNSADFAKHTRGNLSVYGHFDHRVWKNATAFIAYFISPKDRNPFPYFYMTGFVLEELFQKKDRICLGFAYGSYSSELRKYQRKNHKREQNFEAVAELNYHFHPKKWLLLIPDIQYIINPKGLGKYRNALVVGIEAFFQL